MNTRHPTRLAVLALAVLTLIWSSNWIVMKLALADAGPFTFAALRNAGGVALIFLVLRWRGQSLRPPPLQPTLAIGLSQTAAYQGLMLLALVHGNAGKTALLAYTMPFWAVGLAWLLLGTRPGRWQWLCIALAAAGLTLVIAPWQALGQLSSNLLAIASGACWALGTVLAKRLFQRQTVGVLHLTAWQMLYGTVVLIVLALTMPQPALHWTPRLIGALVYNIVLASGLGWTLWVVAVRHLHAHVVSLNSLAIPMLSVLLAWWWLHERPGIYELVGIALIATALLVLAFAPAQAQGERSG